MKGIAKQQTGFRLGTHRLTVVEELAKIVHNGRTYKILRVQTHDGLPYLSMRLYNQTGKFIKQLLIEPCLAAQFSLALAEINTDGA
jgi:hypothetical protein